VEGCAECVRQMVGDISASVSIHGAETAQRSQSRARSGESGDIRVRTALSVETGEV
jgi:hypothetical protein